ncbi:response regulator transcription factor, partial [Kitasatospora sp. NPDC058263]
PCRSWPASGRSSPSSWCGGPADRRSAALEQVAALTTREREVLTLIAAGLSNGQIARRIGVVEGTVKAHVSSVLARLGVANRAAAAVLAHEAGLTTGGTCAGGPRA